MNDPGYSTDHDLLVVQASFPGAHVLLLRGTADVRACEDLEEDFARATDTGLPLIVDLAALEHGDETLLGLLINARRAGGVELVGPLSPSFQRRLDTTGATFWFTVHPTLSAALAHRPGQTRPLDP